MTTSVDTRLPPGLIERARPGKRNDVRSCYGIAGALLHEGISLPDDLAWWIADRLAALAAALSPRNKRPNLEVALWIAEPGKLGRREKTGPVTDEFIVEQCRLEKAQRGGSQREVDERVAAFITAGGYPLGWESVKAARLGKNKKRKAKAAAKAGKKLRK